VNLNDLDQITDAGVLPIAPRRLHELALRHHLPFVIAAVPTPDQPEHIGMLVEVAAGYSPHLVAALIRDIADGLDGGHR
jgi:hypothetical protein